MPRAMPPTSAVITGTRACWASWITSGEFSTQIEGTTIAVERFGGRGGLTFSGTLDGASFDMMVTPAECSDGMSDRTYPFNVTLQLGPETRYGCAWSDARPFTGLAQP